MKAKMILLILLLNSAFFFAQPVVDLPLTIGDGAGSSQVLNLGLDPTATDGIDAGLGEAALGAVPASGTFDTRFILPSGTDYSLKDYRTGTGVFVGTKQHILRSQPGAGSVITIVWNFPAGITGRLQDMVTGTIIDVPMSGNSAYTVMNPAVYNMLRLTITYNLNPAGTPDIPVLSTPADLATGVATNPTLTWLPSAGATTYTLQVSTVNNFASTVFNESGIAATSKAITGLTTSTLYYWRVSATNTNGTSNYSTVFSFTTVGTPPAAPTLLTPANGATGVSLSPDLTWNASAGATSYTLQLSRFSDFSTIAVEQAGIAATNYTIGGPLLEGIVYYWRVAATNANGTGAYSGSRSFTTQITVAPNVPSLSTPADHATDINPSPTVTWINNGGGVTYNLVVATDYWFTNIVLNEVGIATTSYRLLNLTLGQKYYWKVLATNVHGSSDYTLPRDFTVTNVLPIPDPPSLLSPANGAANVPTNPTFTWTALAGATGYALQVSTVADFATTVVNQTGITNATYTASGLNTSTLYYWKVSATNASGTGVFSGAWSFTTTNIPTVPPVPVLSTPADSAINVALKPSLSWSTSLGATRYTVIVSKNADFSSPAVFDTNVTTTIYTVPDSLEKGTLYYWKVKAHNATDSSAYSAPRVFTTLYDIPDVPVLLSPADGGNIYETNMLTWAPAARALTYTLQVSTNASFTSIIFMQAGLTETSFSLTGSFSNSEYYWRVSATNTRGTSAYSSPRIFTTGPTIPAVPVLVSPAQGATSISTSPTLSWGAAARADYYTVQVSTNAAFTNLVVNQNDVYTTTYAVTGLSASTTYYWRVKGVNGIGSSAYSTSRSFTTIAGAPATPTLNAPANNATNVSTSSAVSWIAVSGAVSYTVQVSTNSSFTAMLVNQSGIVTTSYNLALSGGTVYYWRVSAQNASGTSAFSAYRTFTTTGATPPVPVLSLPSSGATNVAVSTKLTWFKSTGAVSYNIQISENAGFTTFFANVTANVDSFYNVVGLRPGIVYYWKVCANNTFGSSAFSTASSFTTASVKYGNITGTGTVTSFDAIEALRMSVGYTTSAWTPSFTYTTNHFMLADVDNNHTAGFVNGSYAVSAYDAYKILWKSLNPSVNLLPIEGGPAKSVASSGTLSLGQFTANGGSDVVSVPLVLSNAVNVNSITFELKYDSKQAEVTGVSGSLPKDWIMAYYNENGKTKIVMAGLTSVKESTLGNVLFKIKNKEDRVAVSGSAFVNEQEAQKLDVMTVNRVPELYVLNQNYPNPFNPTTNISFSLPVESSVRIIIYNSLGQTVKELVNEVRKAGYYETTFNASGLSSGMYFCTMITKSVDGSSSFKGVKKIILMK